MKISWIFPQKKRCGIAIYSINYCNALQNYVDLNFFDPSEFIENSTRFINNLNNSDLIHIQYEPSLFFYGNTCFYKKLVTGIKKPVIVSLHEIYINDPHCFPRSQIKGCIPFLFLKLLIYDFKHPFQTAFRKHSDISFNADSILVHHKYQADILKHMGINENLINLFPHPITIHNQENNIPLYSKVLRIGMTGFINPDYDYNRLFTILEKIDIEWEFWWIGGIRKLEHKSLLNFIRHMILKNGWKDRFHITGWVSSQEQSRLIANLDCALALFKNRSSSGSLNCILGNLKPVISTSLPLFYDINESFNKLEYDPLPLIIINDDPYKIISNLKELKFDKYKKSQKLEQIKKYIHNYSFEKVAKQLYTFYRKFTNK